MQKSFLIDFLSNYFKIPEIKDVSQNGLQVDNANDNVFKIAFAVDANLASIEAAAASEAEMLFVHHGLFWSQSQKITGIHFNRISALIKRDIALFAVHLPLDMHKDVGNNAAMAKALGLSRLEPFGEYKGVKIGFIGYHEKGLGVRECAEILGFDSENGMKIYDFNGKKNHRIAIVSGGAADDVGQAAEAGADLFISGEQSHSAFAMAKETAVNMLLGGHYKSEVFGVRETAKMLKSRFADLECEFLDLPSGM